MPFRSLDIDPELLDSLIEFRTGEQRRFYRALLLLDENERHPSLRVHALEGDLAGQWSASVSDAERITFQRLPNGRKLVLRCSRHYDR